MAVATSSPKNRRAGFLVNPMVKSFILRWGSARDLGVSLVRLTLTLAITATQPSES